MCPVPVCPIDILYTTSTLAAEIRQRLGMQSNVGKHDCITQDCASVSEQRPVLSVRMHGLTPCLEAHPQTVLPHDAYL